MKEHWKEKGVQLRRINIYTPTSNPSERVMSTIAEVFRFYCQNSHQRWVSHIPDVERPLNEVVHHSTQAIPNEIMFRKPATPPVRGISNTNQIPTNEEVLKQFKSAAVIRIDQHQEKHEVSDIREGDIVYINKNSQSDADAHFTQKLSLQPTGPHSVRIVSPIGGNIVLSPLDNTEDDRSKYFSCNIHRVRKVDRPKIIPTPIPP